MQHLRTAVAAVGIAALGLVGGTGPAAAQSPQIHAMSVALPGGGTAQIRYTGTVAPRVTISDAPWSQAAFAPLSAWSGAGLPVAELERVSAEMDRRAAALLGEADALASGQAATSLGRLPPGASGYTFVSTMSGNGVCGRSIEITQSGNGSAPKVVTHTSGDCGGAASAGASTLPTHPAPAPRVPLVETATSAPNPVPGWCARRFGGIDPVTDPVAREPGRLPSRAVGCPSAASFWRAAPTKYHLGLERARARDVDAVTTRPRAPEQQQRSW